MGSTDPTGPVYKHMKPPGPHFDLDNTLVHIQILQNNRVQVLCERPRRTLTERFPGAPATALLAGSMSLAHSTHMPSSSSRRAAELHFRRLAGSLLRHSSFTRDHAAAAQRQVERRQVGQVGPKRGGQLRECRARAQSEVLQL